MNYKIEIDDNITNNDSSPIEKLKYEKFKQHVNLFSLQFKNT